MAGSFRSRIFIAAIAGLALAVSVTRTVVETAVVRSWYRFTSWVDTAIAWTVSKLPAAQADWIRGWHRAAPAQGMNSITMREKRRPLVCPRFRMCPST